MGQAEQDEGGKRQVVGVVRPHGCMGDASGISLKSLVELAQCRSREARDHPVRDVMPNVAS